ncbi:MAG: hypothetical protein HYW85_03760 [Deltaproteobacteria bacterium]|nr:hypothetical protein [Deltaproteobacteria bacterium]
MKKFVLLALFASFPLTTWAAKSLEFGGEGSETTARLHVYVDESDPAPKCGPNCVRYSVLVDEGWRVGNTRIEKIVVLTEHPYVEDLSSPVLHPSALWRDRHPGSPAKTDQVVISLTSASEESAVEDLHFEVLALKRKCMNPTLAECKELEIDTQGSFSGRQLKELRPVAVKALLKPQPK